MDVVALHTAIQVACLTGISIVTVIVGAVGQSYYSSENKVDSGASGFLLLMLPIILPMFLVLVQATYYGRRASASLEELRNFSLADVDCFSQVDRDAILRLIGRWFADAGEDEANGIHNFEMFVRRDVHEKVAGALGTGSFGGSGWPLVLTLLMWMFLALGWFLDEVSVPEFNLWHLVSALGDVLPMQRGSNPLDQPRCASHGMLATHSAPRFQRSQVLACHSCPLL